MLTKNEIKKHLNNWDLNVSNLVINNAQIEEKHMTNESYEIGDHYILKSGKNIPWMLTHVKMTKALHAAGLESPHPIQTKNGDDYIIDGDTYYMVLHKVKGKFLSKEERIHSDGRLIGLEYGKALGKLHLVLKAIEEDMEVIDSDIIDILSSWSIPVTKKHTKQWGSVLPDEFYKKLETEGFPLLKSIPKQLVHRDPNPRTQTETCRNVTNCCCNSCSSQSVWHLCLNVINVIRC